MSLKSISQQSFNDSLTESLPESLIKESVIILKGPDYHESVPKMRRVDLLQRQILEKE